MRKIDMKHLVCSLALFATLPVLAEVPEWTIPKSLAKCVWIEGDRLIVDVPPDERRGSVKLADSSLLRRRVGNVSISMSGSLDAEVWHRVSASRAACHGRQPSVRRQVS